MVAWSSRGISLLLAAIVGAASLLNLPSVSGSEADCPTVSMPYLGGEPGNPACELLPEEVPMDQLCTSLGPYLDQMAATQDATMSHQGEIAIVETCGRQVPIPQESLILGCEFILLLAQESGEEIVGMYDETFGCGEHAAPVEVDVCQALLQPATSTGNNLLQDLEAPEQFVFDTINEAMETYNSTYHEVNETSGGLLEGDAPGHLSFNEFPVESEALNQALGWIHILLETDDMESPSSCPYSPGGVQPIFRYPPCLWPTRDPNGNVDVTAWAMHLVEDCWVVCEPNPTLCEFLYRQAIFIRDFADAVLENNGDYVVETAWSHLHMEREREVTEDGRQTTSPYPEADRCRTAVANGTGEWSLRFLAGGPGGGGGFAPELPSIPPTLPPPAGSPAPDVGYTGLVREFSLNVVDEGAIKQGICYIHGGWEEVIPPTRLPPTPEQIAEANWRCHKKAFFTVLSGITSAALVFTPAGAWGAAVGMEATAAMASDTADACTDADRLEDDIGYMKCTGTAATAWGPANSFASTWLTVGDPLGLVSLNVGGQSAGDGYNLTEFPVSYDGEGYWQGLEKCKQQMHEARTAAYEAYQSWGLTVGQGNASLSAHLHASAVMPMVLGSARALTPDVAFDLVRNTLIIECPRLPCDLDVSIGVVSNGTQNMTPGNGDVTYEFTADPGATAFDLTINGESIEVSLPLRMDGQFTATGGWDDSDDGGPIGGMLT